MNIDFRCTKCGYPVHARLWNHFIHIDPCPCQQITSMEANHKYATTENQAQSQCLGSAWPYPTARELNKIEVVDRKCSACGQEKRMDCGRINEYGRFTCNDCLEGE